MVVIACSLIHAGVPLSKIFSGYFVTVMEAFSRFWYAITLHTRICLGKLSVMHECHYQVAGEVCGSCQSWTSLFVAIVSHERHYLVAGEVCGNCHHRQLPQICPLSSDLISTGEPPSLQLVCNQGNHSVDKNNQLVFACIYLVDFSYVMFLQAMLLRGEALCQQSKGRGGWVYAQGKSTWKPCAWLQKA